MILALKEVLPWNRPLPNVLHVAPEARVRRFLAPIAGAYVATDLTLGLSSYAGQLSVASDLTRLPFRADAFDLVVASHVLEHIVDDRAAAREVHRVLRPGGIALLPVPIVHDGSTIEYGAPKPLEEMHTRAPGLDYFGRFEELGFDVVVRRSSDYPRRHQVHSYHTRYLRGEGDALLPVRSRAASASEQYIPVCLKGAEHEDVLRWKAEHSHAAETVTHREMTAKPMIRAR